MNDIMPKEASEILSHYTDLGYGVVIEGEDISKIKQALSLASKTLANGTPYVVDCKNCDGYEAGYSAGVRDTERPQGEWYDFIPNCLKARHGEYVLYKVDFLLDNLAREVNIMESARRMKGGAEE